MKFAVIYYSRTGNTRFVAEAIAADLNCPLLGLQDQKNRAGIWGYILAGRDALFKRKTQLVKYEFSPNEAELVFIGLPNWASTLPPAIRTFLAENNLAGKQVVLFLTQQASGAERVFANLRQILSGSEILETKVFNKVLASQEQIKIEVVSWLQKYH